MIEPDLRKLILDKPEQLLEDRDVMNALVAANERAMGGNVVDLRAIAMKRLETQLDKLEDTHRSVIAAAYENLAGTSLIHRAILQLLEARDLSSFITLMAGQVAQTLRIDDWRLVLEPRPEGQDIDPALRRFGDRLHVGPADFVALYITNGRARAPKPVVLRPVTPLAVAIFGGGAQALRSEALMMLDLGPGRQPAMLVFGSNDPRMFKALQATDLLAFFAGVFERILRQWLA